MSDPHWDNVSLLMHMDGANGSTTFVDETGKTASAVAGAQVSATQSKFGGTSAWINGGCVEVGAPVDWAFLHNDTLFTVECYVYLVGGSTEHCILSTGSSTAHIGTYFTVLGNNGNKLNLTMLRGVSSNYITWTSTDGIPLNTWTHVAFVFNPVGRTGYFYIDGVQSGQGGGTVVSAWSPPSANPTYPLAIGGYQDPTRYGFFNGYIDELRITKAVARYTTSFTPPTAPFPDTNPPPLIDAILSGQLGPSPLSQLLVTNWPVIGAETSGTLSPSGFITINNPQIIEGLFSGTMSPTGSVMVSAYWLIEAVASGRLSPSQAAHILVDNLDPNQGDFAQIIGEIELYSRVILSARMAGKLDLSGTMLLTPEHEAQVAGTLRLINGETSSCWCGNG